MSCSRPSGARMRSRISFAIVVAGDRLDHHRLGQMRGAAVVLQPRSGRPIEREIAHFGAHPRVIGPGGRRHVAVRVAALVRHHLVQGDVGFAARGEFRQVVGDPVHRRERALLDQAPDGGRGQHLGLGEQQEQRIVGGGHGGGFGARAAEAAEQRQLAVPRHGDLRAGIASVLQMPRDQRVERGEAARIEAEAGGVALGQWVCVGHGGFLSSRSGRWRAGRRKRSPAWGIGCRADASRRRFRSRR